jgi:hypothetical protein
MGREVAEEMTQQQNKAGGAGMRRREEKKKMAIAEQKAGPKSTQGASQASQSAHKQRGEVAEEVVQQPL